MKIIVLAFFLFTNTTSRIAAISDVDENVLKAFKETFSYAEDVIWRQSGNLFHVDFWQASINVSAYYNEWGDLLKTFRYYNEKQLAPMIVSKIKKRYPGRSIMSVTEVCTHDEITYYVCVQDERNLINIQLDAYGNLLRTRKYIRGDK